MAVHHPGVEQQLQALVRQVRREALATIQNASIGRSGLRVYDGGWIRIENGGLSVTGTAMIQGRLEGSGTLLWTGPWELKGNGVISGNTEGTGLLQWTGQWSLDGAGEITGDTNITGNLTGDGEMLWNGPWEMRGNGEITGDVEIAGDMDVTANGRIKVGAMTLNPVGDNGSMRFSNGAAVYSFLDRVALASGSVSLGVGTGGIYMNTVGVPTITGTGLPDGTLVLSAAGLVQRAID